MKNETNVSSKKRRKRCSSCGQLRYDVVLDEDPYRSELYSDHTKVLMCVECRNNIADDI